MKDNKKLKILVGVLSVVLLVLVLIIFLPLGDEEEIKAPTATEEEIDIFDIAFDNPATCYISDESAIEALRGELSDFPDLDVESITFRTEDYNVLYANFMHGDRRFAILVDMAKGEIEWASKFDETLSDLP